MTFSSFQIPGTETIQVIFQTRSCINMHLPIPSNIASSESELVYSVVGWYQTREVWSTSRWSDDHPSGENVITWPWFHAG